MSIPQTREDVKSAAVEEVKSSVIRVLDTLMGGDLVFNVADFAQQIGKAFSGFGALIVEVKVEHAIQQLATEKEWLKKRGYKYSHMAKFRGIVLPTVESVHLAGAVLEEIDVEATKRETSLRSVKDTEAAITDESATLTRTGTESMKTDETDPEPAKTDETDPNADKAAPEAIRTGDTDPRPAKADENGSQPNKKKTLKRVRALNQFYGLEPGWRVHPDVKKAGIRLAVDYPYAKAANLLGGVSAMTIWRAINKYAPPEMPLPDEKRRVPILEVCMDEFHIDTYEGSRQLLSEPSPKAA